MLQSHLTFFLSRVWNQPALKEPSLLLLKSSIYKPASRCWIHALLLGSHGCQLLSVYSYSNRGAHDVCTAVVHAHATPYHRPPFCLWEFGYSVYFMCVEPFSICLLRTGLFHPAECPIPVVARVRIYFLFKVTYCWPAWHFSVSHKYILKYLTPNNTPNSHYLWYLYLPMQPSYANEVIAEVLAHALKEGSLWHLSALSLFPWCPSLTWAGG